MANIIEMPKLSDTMTVGTLVKWLKKEGDAVKTGDTLAEIETDKATMELESFFDGVLLAIFMPAGSQVPIGAALCAVGKAGEKVSAPAPAAAPAAPAAPAALPLPPQSPPPPRRQPRPPHPLPLRLPRPPRPRPRPHPPPRTRRLASRFHPWHAAWRRKRESAPPGWPARAPVAG